MTAAHLQQLIEMVPRAPVLDPGRGRTKLGQLWGYARDDHPWRGGATASPAQHLAGYRGVLPTGGCAFR